jgi:hypothetical protein
MVLPCQILSRINLGIVLALDWNASLCECMLGLGQPVLTSFGPWALLSGSDTFKAPTNRKPDLTIHTVPEIVALAPTHTPSYVYKPPSYRNINLPIHVGALPYPHKYPETMSLHFLNLKCEPYS